MALKRPEDSGSLHEYLRGLLEDGRDLRKGHEAMWWESIATYAGDLWAEFNPHDRRLYELPKPSDRVRLPINLVQPVVRTEYAKMLKNKPIIDCVARSGDIKDMHAADVGDKIMNEYVEKRFNAPSLRRGAAWWTLVTGIGGLFIDYDKTAQGSIEVPAGPAGEPVFDPAQIKSIQRYYREKQHRRAPVVTSNYGDLRFGALSPWQFIWDFSKNHPHEAAWSIITETYDVLEAERRWGVPIQADKKSKPNVMEYRLLNSMDLTQKLDFNNKVTDNLAEVHRAFFKPGHLYFPRGIEAVFTEDELIWVDYYPYAHGELPYAVMGHVPFLVSRYPMSVITQIKAPTLEISKTESQMIENRNMMANPPWLEYDQNRLSEDAIVNKPGLRIKVQWMPGVPPPEPVQMPDLPGYVKDLPTILKEHVLEISGQGETSQGRVPPGARSGVAIAYLQEEDDTKLGPTVQEFEEMIERWGWITLQTMAQYYDIPRTVSLYRRHSEPEVFDFYGSMLQGVAALECQAGSALPRSKAAKQQFMFDLWDRGVVQDPNELMDMLELSQSKPADWKVAEQQAERENVRLSQGNQCNVEEWYDDAIHIAVHTRQMNSADWDDYSDQVKNAFRAHYQLHITSQRNKAMTNAAMSVLPGMQQQNQNGGAQLASANGMNQPVQEGGPTGSTATPPPLTSAEPQ
jgi:hypothetical protein